METKKGITLLLPNILTVIFSKKGKVNENKIKVRYNNADSLIDFFVNLDIK